MGQAQNQDKMRRGRTPMATLKNTDGALLFNLLNKGECPFIMERMYPSLEVLPAAVASRLQASGFFRPE
jgi:hypothetical protein